jgi:DNA-directed RNA polymerase specialized sigma subunit
MTALLPLEWNRLEHTETEAVRHYMPLVYSQVKRLRARLFPVDVDDLKASGCIGLLKALRSSRAGVVEPMFRGYAVICIFSAMMDDWRGAQFVGRRGQKQGVKATFIDVDDWHSEPGEWPYDRVDARLELEAIVARANLSGSQLEALMAPSPAKLARHWGVSPPRVAQIREQALEKCRAVAETARRVSA